MPVTATVTALGTASVYEGRDMDFHNKKAGSSTTSEVQLIGCGVRYFPFAFKDKEKKPP